MDLPKRNKSKTLVTAIPPSTSSTQTSNDSDLTPLRIALTTCQQALDQREVRLVVRQERIEGMDERVREVQMIAGYREEAVG